MSSYDLDIRNYDEGELCNFLCINDNLDAVSQSVIAKHAEKFKNTIDSNKLSDKEKTSFFTFIENAKQKLISYVARRSPVQLPPTNYNIIQSQNQLIGANHNVIADKIVPVVNTFSNPFPDGVINPLEKRYFTKVISVDSLFRPNYDSSRSNNFQWTLPQSENRVVSMKLVSVELPVMWYDISDKLGNNEFKIRIYNMKDVNDVTHTITIPPGHYGHIDFANVLNNLFLNIGGGLEYLTVGVNHITSKTVIHAQNIYDITSTNYSPSFYFELIFDNAVNNDTREVNLTFRKSLGWYMGFRKPKYVVTRANRFIDMISQSTGKLVYEGYVSSESSFGSGKGHYIYIVVDDYNKNTMTQTISSNVGDVFVGNNILGRISIENSSNEIMINQSDKIFRQRDYLGPVTLSKMNIRLLNRFGDPIDINNNDFSMALELKVLY
tara:strand:+ start:1737 stop:3047 length:1311 start_codon:yes stop_codon:yes gene_type:complete